MKFKACEFLSFDKSKFSCELVRISDHLGWEREDFDGNIQLCQQCTKRGRLNGQEACIGKCNAMCSDYMEKEYEID